MPHCRDHEIEQLAGLHERPVVKAEPSVGTLVPTKQAVYIAGPMRGIPYYNFPAFDAAADELRGVGYIVLSPADLDREGGFDAMDCPPDTDWDAIPDGFDFEACVARDIEGVKCADAIYLLPGWERSTGARAEKMIAKWLGRAVFFADGARKEADDTVLDEAKGHVYGDRGADYGHPADDHGKVAGAMTALLKDKLRPGVELTALDVELFMVLIKMSRLTHKYKRDSVVDIAGYAATMEMSEQRRREAEDALIQSEGEWAVFAAAEGARESCDPPDSGCRMTFSDGLGGSYPCHWDAASQRYVPDYDPRR